MTIINKNKKNNNYLTKKKKSGSFSGQDQIPSVLFTGKLHFTVIQSNHFVSIE